MIKKVKSISGFYRLLKEVNELKNPIFRGHSSIKYELKSSSFRRLENKYKEISKVRKNLSLYHGQLIEEFKENKYHQSQIGELTDLEILAKLQHYGAATCFMDFSRNIAVALWFACSSKENVDGRVYILKNTQDVLSYKRINSTQLKYNIGKFYEDYLSDENEDTKENELTKHFLLWEPPYLSERILQQDSIFLFSKKELELDSEEFLHRVDIDKSLKKEILKILNKLFNINKKNIYKDFHGFASSHAQNEEIDFIDDGIKYFEIANQYYQADEYEKALEFYQKAMDDSIDDKRVLIEIYENIAIIYKDRFTFSSLKKALEYQIKAVEINEKVLDKNHPSLATSYNNLSLIYKDLGGDENLGKALEYIDKAIEIFNVAFPAGHRNLEIIEKNRKILIDEMKK
ncbi:MAG: FRG domain-containing protein [Aliarcobacter sp.]|nr:FRG domain-containing protein [Aliarcobacter sp.]